MSYNRLEYDSCYAEQQTNDSVSPLMYSMYSGKFQNCERCTTESGGKGEIDFSKRVALETELYNMTRKTSKCVGQNYTPNCTDPTNCPNTALASIVGEGFQYQPPTLCGNYHAPMLNNNILRPSGPGFNPDTLVTEACPQ